MTNKRLKPLSFVSHICNHPGAMGLIFISFVTQFASLAAARQEEFESASLSTRLSGFPNFAPPDPGNHTRDGIPDGVVCDATEWCVNL